jgi:hypothetical protein
MAQFPRPFVLSLEGEATMKMTVQELRNALKQRFDELEGLPADQEVDSQAYFAIELLTVPLWQRLLRDNYDYAARGLVLDLLVNCIEWDCQAAAEPLDAQEEARRARDHEDAMAILGDADGSKLRSWLAQYCEPPPLGMLRAAPLHSFSATSPPRGDSCPNFRPFQV